MAVIEKNIPMPEKGLRTDIKQLLDEGEIGDSIFLENASQQTVSATCNQVGGKGTFTTQAAEQKTEFGVVSGVRVWLKNKPMVMAATVAE